MIKKQNEVKNTKYKDKEEIKPRYVLPIKQFENRRSLLVEIVEDNIHVRAGYNVIISFSLFTMLTINLKEYLQNGRVSPAIDLIYEKFGKLHISFVIWLANNLCTIICYYCFIFWSKIRQKVPNKNILDKFCITLLIGYCGCSFYSITYLLYHFEIPFASATIITTESIRLLLKIHAFIRSNAPKVLIRKSEKEHLQLPTVLKFVHFLFVPTAVYRDNYPRSEKTRWGFVLCRLLEILWAILCQAHVYIYTVYPVVKDTCKDMKQMTGLEFFTLLMQISIPNMVLLWLLFLSAIHSSQNAVGEIVQFGDRMFYSDWWNSLDAQQYYKKWNWVVGDWLHTYLNKDLSEVVFPGKINLAKLLTILISAILHEWLITAVNGFFCPSVGCMMMVSFVLVLFIKVKKNHNIINIINLFIMPITTGFMGGFMLVEYYARQNLPSKNDEMFVFWNNCINGTKAESFHWQSH